MIMRGIIGFMLCCFSGLLWADSAKIDGLWEAYYQKSGTPSSNIRIKTLPSGEVQGVIEKAFPRPGEHPSSNCTACKGANKNKPIVGMMIMYGMEPNGKNQWDQGHLLDPETGKTYTGKMTLSSDGKSLDLRGYVFNPAFGQTDTWKRIG
jgi:uncharacterized protein (DUF2147 family)